MKIARNWADFVKRTKTQRDIGALVTHAAAFLHNEGLRLKALDPQRDVENARLMRSMERVMLRVASLHARSRVSDVLSAPGLDYAATKE